jgi:hydroxypyruvate reductase
MRWFNIASRASTCSVTLKEVLMSQTQSLREDAVAIFRAALAAANASDAVKHHLRKTEAQLRAGHARFTLKRINRVIVVAVGKAAPQMAEAIEHRIGDKFTRGLVVTKHGHTASYSGKYEVIESGHPIPDGESLRAGQAVLAMLHDLTAKDLLIVAVSGGASSLLCAPVEGVSLAAKQQTTDLLLRAGADIYELNAVRKHLSMLKGGNLAARAYPAPVLSLLLSDVVGDRLDVIGSGLTAPDQSTFTQAVQVLEKRSVLQQIPGEVREYLEKGAGGEITETPKPGDGLFENVTNVVVGNSGQALEAASEEAKRRGYRPLILSSRIQGEAREAARFHADILWETITSGHPLRSPACILSGGETTVTVSGQGKGGRNQEFALAAAITLAGAPSIVCLSAGTDGTDGPTDAAGAIVSGDTVARAAKLGLNAADYLARNDSYPFFDALGDLLKTGPTGTNVMDVNVMLAG